MFLGIIKNKSFFYLFHCMKSLLALTLLPISALRAHFLQIRIGCFVFPQKPADKNAIKCYSHKHTMQHLFHKIQFWCWESYQHHSLIHSTHSLRLFSSDTFSTHRHTHTLAHTHIHTPKTFSYNLSLASVVSPC